MTMPLKITELWAWVREDVGDGEGILAAEMEIEGQRMFVPLIGADRERIESYRPFAEEMARASGRPIKLMRYSQAERIQRYVPPR